MILSNSLENKRQNGVCLKLPLHETESVYFIFLFTKEDREDLGLSKLMKQANRSEKVSREQVMKSLLGE
jgi:hypothetical protein